MDLILLAGGTGDRSGLPYPKPLFPIHGKPIIRILIDLFRPLVDQIIIPCGEEVAEVCTDCIIVTPGRTRQESVYNALQKVTTDRVIIHGAVRPFITEEFAKRVMAEFEDCIVPVVAVKPSVYNSQNCWHEVRDWLREIQLPQVFNTRKLLKAHEEAKDMSWTDDSSLYCAHYDEYPRLIDGLDCNLKLTTPFDFKIATAIWEAIH